MGKHMGIMRRSTRYTFGGPIGALVLMLGLPTVVYWFAIGCSKTECSLMPSTIRAHWAGWRYFFDIEAGMYYILWISILIGLWFFLPGKRVEGLPLRDGSSLEYRMNGLKAMVVIFSGIISVFLIDPETGISGALWLCNHLLEITSAALTTAILLSVFVYIQSVFCKNVHLTLEGNTGNLIYDFFVGRPLNPRVGSFDIKFFCELRPGLLLWCVINLGYIVKQYTLYGKVFDSIILVCAFQIFYVITALWNERAVLSTMDIVTDGFGFMLAFGNLVWVPMLYTLQVRFLSVHPIELGVINVLALICLQSIGYIIFHGANRQKNTFRTNPNHPSVKHLDYIQTKNGNKLLISGWWGKARHVNYFGDWLMALAWCLPCGFSSPIPYFYAVYFAILLLHRQKRDDVKCKEKYGADWERYIQLVRWRIIPYVY